MRWFRLWRSVDGLAAGPALAAAVRSRPARMRSADSVICCSAIDVFILPVRTGEKSAILGRFATVSGKLRYGR